MHQRKEVRGRRKSIWIFAKASAARHRHPRESGDPEKRKSICSRKRNPLRSSSPRSGVLRRGRTLCGHLGACRRAGTHTEFMVRQAHHERSDAARRERNEFACLEQGYLTGQEWGCGIRVRSPLSEGRGVSARRAGFGCSVRILGSRVRGNDELWTGSVRQPLRHLVDGIFHRVAQVV